ncbi:MAG: replicative DNA helicase [Ruminococcaceae bacterium]|nr:replicative DNA helicase [Oscillospiraceae bacterium]
MTDEFARKLPFSMIAEQSLLGSVLIDPQSLNDVVEIITADDFYLTEHTQIFTAMRELFLVNKEIDVVTLIDTLVTKGIYDKSGGEDYIRTLYQAVPNSLNVKDYATIVKQKSLLRKLIDACSDISEKAYSEEGDAGQLVDFAESTIFDIAQGRDTKSFRHIRDVIRNVYENLHTMATEGESAQGTKTGFSGIDNVLAGMGNSDLILVGARPGMGKTSFALNIGTNVALQTGKTVCMFSLEMSAEQLVTRVISSEAMIDSYALRTGKLDPKQWEDIAAATTRLSGCNILIDDTSGITVTGMKGKLRRIKNLGLVVIDYLQLMQSDRRNDGNRVQEVADISRALKIMAKELNVPIICCAQLSRGPESRTDKRPMLSDLRDSGAIEQDADTVIFLYRDEYYVTDKNDEESSVAEVIIAKNRHGSTGTVKVGWIGRYTKFRSIATDVGEG